MIDKEMITVQKAYHETPSLPAMSESELKKNIKTLVNSLETARNEISIAYSVANYLLDSLGDTEENALSELITHLGNASGRIARDNLEASFSLEPLFSDRIESKG